MWVVVCWDRSEYLTFTSLGSGIGVRDCLNFGLGEAITLLLFNQHINNPEFTGTEIVGRWCRMHVEITILSATEADRLRDISPFVLSALERNHLRY